MASSVEEIGWHDPICHTNFSFLVGASHPDELVARAADLGYRSLAVTDFDGVYGLARAHRALAALRKQGRDGGLRLLHGAEFHLSKCHDDPILLRDTLVLVATSLHGYQNLCRLVTHAHRAGKTAADLPLEYLLASDVTGLVAIAPMRGLVHLGRLDLLRARMAALGEHFQGRAHLAVTRLRNPAEDRAIVSTLEVARELGLRCVLSQDAFFHEVGCKPLSDVLHAIRTNQQVPRAGRHLFVNAERSLHTLVQLEKRYASLPIHRSALETAREIAESSSFDLSQLAYRYPKEMLPPGATAQGFLEEITWQHAKAFYGDIPSQVAHSIEHELRLVGHLGFADYFLTVWDIVRWAREQRILCQGRGSAANSAVCFVLGITSVDPATSQLLFERFMSVERGDPPDIDVDFEHERREEVIQYIYRRYGRDRAAMVANVITFQRRGAIRAVGKALGIGDELLGEAAKLLETRAYRGASSAMALGELAADTPPSEAATFPDLGIPWGLWAALADRLRGFPRHLGIHSGGFMLADQPLTHLVATEPATMAGRTVIQWSKEDIEALGFFKIDVLALGILTAIRKCLDLVASHHRRRLDLAAIPEGDEKTYAMIQRADTVGTFQIESRAQMSMLPRLKPRCFYDLAIEVAIIRPGPIQGKMIHPFLRRRNGLEPVTFADERLRPILERTLGIPIFQEQVMRVAMAVGGFTPGEADELRKNLGSFSMKGKIETWMGKLEAGMRANGLAEEFIAQILGQLDGFAHYGFPESHAASFARLAYASSYLKCHYPAAFFASLLNSQPMGFYSPHVLVQTARHTGVAVLPVCAATSSWDATLERLPGARKYALRLGLRLVGSLREETARRLVAERKRVGAWRDLEHLLQACGLRRADLTALAAANALTSFGIDRRAAIWLAEAAPYASYLEDAAVDEVRFAPERAFDRVQADFHATGTSLGPHPVEIMRDSAWLFPVETRALTKADEIERTATGRRVRIFGMVIVRQAPPSANGMLFLTLEDETGLINVAVTPDVYGRYRKLVDGQAFLCLVGRLQRQDSAHSVLVQEVVAPTLHHAAVIPIAAPIRQSLATELAPARNYM